MRRSLVAQPRSRSPRPTGRRRPAEHPQPSGHRPSRPAPAAPIHNEQPYARDLASHDVPSATSARPKPGEGGVSAVTPGAQNGRSLGQPVVAPELGLLLTPA